MAPLISVLVPVYNNEKYIGQCVESIIHQTFTNWELILVDDGSTDSSPSICDKYASDDCRIKVIHEENRGVASARNTGLDYAAGDWIMMVDGDDWISCDTLKKTFDKAVESNSDIVRFGVFYEYGKYSRVCIPEVLEHKSDYVCRMISRHYILSAWGNLVKAAIWRNINPRFTAGLDFGEDYSVTPRLFHEAEKIEILNQPLYHYRQNLSGYVHSFNRKSAQNLVSCERVIDHFFSNIDDQLYVHSLQIGRQEIKAFIIERFLMTNHICIPDLKWAIGLYFGESLPCGLSKHAKWILSLSRGYIGFAILCCYGRIRHIISSFRDFIVANSTRF